MAYRAKDYSHLFGMKGFSKKLLENHFELYQGYVENTNKLLEKISGLEKNPKEPQFAEEKRRLGWEWNGMRLHEYYFDNLGGTSKLKSSPLKDAIEREFREFSAWEEEFRAVGGMRGIGWAALYQDPFTGKLINCWINEHDTGHLSGCSLILLLDVFEHAFMIDYGLKKDEYITAFFNNLNWEIVTERFEDATIIEPVDVSIAPTK